MQFSLFTRQRFWAIFAVAAFLILNINALHMHPDEELSYRATEGGLLETLRWQIDLEDNQAPLWFLIFRIWRTFVGDAEFTSRVMGVLLVLPALALVSHMARRAFGGLAGMFAPLTLVGNALFFQYALDIRMYPLVMLVSTGSAYLLWRWLEQRTMRAALFYGMSVGVMLYTHYLLVFWVLLHGIYALAVLMPSRRDLWRQFIMQGLAAGGVAVILFLPWMPVAVSQVNHLRTVEAAAGTARGSVGIGVSTLPTTPENITALADFATSGLWVIYAALLGVGLVIAGRGKCSRRMVVLALLWTLAVPGVYLAANLTAGVYAPRYVSYLTLGLALALGGTFALLPIPQLLRWMALACLIAANLINFPATLPVRVPYRDLLHEVSESSSGGEVVLLSHAGEEDGFVRWQYEHYLRPDLRDSITTDLAAAREARRVWLITGDWFNDDVRAAFDSLEPGHPVQRVIGACDRAWCYLAQLMEAPPLRDPILFGDVLAFRGVDVDTADQAGVSVRLWWTVQTALPVDYSFSVQLLTGGGRLIAQHDGAINHYRAEHVETSAMQPGQIYIDHRTIMLEPSIPPGVYRLALVVYQSWDGLRLITPEGDSLIIADVRIE